MKTNKLVSFQDMTDKQLDEYHDHVFGEAIEKHPDKVESYKPYSQGSSVKDEDALAMVDIEIYLT